MYWNALSEWEQGALMIQGLFPQKTLRDVFPIIFPNENKSTCYRQCRIARKKLMEYGLIDDESNITEKGLILVTKNIDTVNLIFSLKEFYELHNEYNDLLEGNDDYGVISELEEEIKRLRVELTQLILEKSSIVEFDASEFELLPSEIKAEIISDFNEAAKCLNARAPKAGIVMCARAIEISLHYIYFNNVGKEPGQITLGQLINKLREKNVDLPHKIEDDISFIKKIRNYSVHKQTKPFYPSIRRAKIMYELSIECINELFASVE